MKQLGCLFQTTQCSAKSTKRWAWLGVELEGMRGGSRGGLVQLSEVPFAVR